MLLCHQAHQVLKEGKERRTRGEPSKALDSVPQHFHGVMRATACSHLVWSSISSSSVVSALGHCSQMHPGTAKHSLSCRQLLWAGKALLVGIWRLEGASSHAVS